MLPFIYFFWHMDSQALQMKNIFIFSLIIIFALVGNFFIYYSIKGEKISNIEPAKITEPLFTILLAVLFSFLFGEALYSKNINVIIPAFIAAGALIFSHIEKHHLKFNKYFIAAILGSFFFAMEMVTSRLILDFYSPITFYFLRSASILLISLIAFMPELKKAKKIPYIVLLTGVMWVIYRLVVYYGYLAYGIVFTTLIIMLGPVFIYIFAGTFLKEKIRIKHLIASAVVIACVLYATLS